MGNPHNFWYMDTTKHSRPGWMASIHFRTVAHFLKGIKGIYTGREKMSSEDTLNL